MSTPRKHSCQQSRFFPLPQECCFSKEMASKLITTMTLTSATSVRCPTQVLFLFSARDSMEPSLESTISALKLSLRSKARNWTNVCPAKCLNCLRSFMKHEQQKWKTIRPTNPKQPQLPGKSRKCLRSWMMHGQLKWKTERPPSTNPKLPQIPAKCLKCLRSFMKHEQQKRKTMQKRFLQRTRNSRNCLESPESVFVREWCADNWNGRQRGFPQRTRKCRKSPQSA